ncbi:MAG: TetR/AcrR family transcriptional regulator [Actinomycetota bacterium]|nr:TetR/AcrR family transcriptional regulator [Actinomycetota bacterium]
MPTATTRANLSRELILDAALRLVDADGEEGLTFRRLGAELGADPTAVYRYFRSKDDLLLAVADAIIGQTLATVPDHDGWRTTLRTLAEAIYQSALHHPRLAVLISSRTTQGQAEAQAIERVLTVLDRAGLEPAEAVAVWRAFFDSVLAWAGMTAAFLSLPPETRSKDLSAWSGTYPNISSTQFPHLHRAGPLLADAEAKDPFHDAVDLLLDGIAARLPDRPRKDMP